MSEVNIISLGGSLIVPEEIDVKFLKAFRDLVIFEISKGKKFVIITGGGQTARKYQNSVKEVKSVSSFDLDWLGIHATRFNAELLQIIFSDVAEENIIIDPTIPTELQKDVAIGGGWKPGFSTDYVAISVAQGLGIKKVINLSNADYVYSSDPKTDALAQKIEKISWPEYRNLIPKEWNPGLNTPFDPIASKFAEEAGIEVSILGKNVPNLGKCLNGESFQGTIISPVPH